MVLAMVAAYHAASHAHRVLPIIEGLVLGSGLTALGVGFFISWAPPPPPPDPPSDPLDGIREDIRALRQDVIESTAEIQRTIEIRHDGN
jgi:hypothetical protein